MFETYHGISSSHVYQDLLITQRQGQLAWIQNSSDAPELLHLQPKGALRRFAAWPWHAMATIRCSFRTKPPAMRT